MDQSKDRGIQGNTKELITMTPYIEAKKAEVREKWRAYSAGEFVDPVPFFHKEIDTLLDEIESRVVKAVDCPNQCQNGNVPLGQPVDEDGNETGPFEWGGCDHCVVNGQYQPREEVEEVINVFQHLRTGGGTK